MMAVQRLVWVANWLDELLICWKLANVYQQVQTGVKCSHLDDTAGMSYDDMDKR